LCANIANEFRFLSNEGAILAVLEKGGARFKDLEERTRLSPRTLWKHLQSMSARGLIEGNGGYRITSVGSKHLESLEEKLRSLSQLEKRPASIRARLLPRHYAVEVTRVTPSEKCVGLFRVSLVRELNFRERDKMDRALTEAINLIVNSIPADTKEYNATIAGPFKSAVR
jgi:DNA-binding Lrp family transcriptional regulator